MLFQVESWLTNLWQEHQSPGWKSDCRICLFKISEVKLLELWQTKNRNHIIIVGNGDFSIQIKGWVSIANSSTVVTACHSNLKCSKTISKV